MDPKAIEIRETVRFLATADLHRGFTEKTAEIQDKYWRRYWEPRMDDFDAILVAGDLSSTKRDHFYRCLKWLRRIAKDKAVFIVRGNHDFWDASTRMAMDTGIPHYRSIARYDDMDELNLQHMAWCKEFGIHYLEFNPVVFKDVLLIGWDGWYERKPDSNDHRFMPEYFDTWLRAKEDRARLAVIDALDGQIPNQAGCYNKVVAMTHFPMQGYLDRGAAPGFMRLLEGRVDVLITGHLHYGYDYVSEGGTMRLINPGADYNRPFFKIFSV